MISPDSITDLADGRSPTFVCSYTDGGVAAARAHVAGALDIVTAPQRERTLRDAQRQAWLVLLLRGVPDVDRMFALTGSADKVEIGDVDLDPETRPVALQRSLVSSSLLKTGENARERRSSQ